MATSLPSSFSYEMLSRLPANSFVQTWKEIRPDQMPTSGFYDVSQPHNLRFVLRGAPNEFALNTNMYLCGSTNLNVVIGNTANFMTGAEVGEFLKNCPAQLKSAINYFDSSRESFNAGALPYLDNQDPQRSNVISHMRYRLARRNAVDKGSRIQDLKGAFNLAYNESLEADLTSLFFDSSEGVRVAYPTAANTYQSLGADSKKFKIPLGTYSNFVNSHSILPLGLMSSYAVNGWQIELRTSTQSGTTIGDYQNISGKVYELHALDPAKFGAGAGYKSARAYHQDIRIFVPIIRVLDPAVMEAVLSLYEKREQVAVGGVSFPLSLRLNSIAYRFSNFALNNQKDYFFRIAGTDRSVRAVAWWIYNTGRAQSGTYDIFRQALRVTRLETNIGSEHLHDVVEDQTVNSNNVSNFISMNAKRSACLFSPLPYYQEGRKFDGHQDDDIDKYNNSTTNLFVVNPAPVSSPVYVRNCVAYGVISMENLDRRESEYSGSFQASGKDLTNVGAIEMRMRIEKYPEDGLGVSATGGDDATAVGNAVNVLQSPYASSTAPGDGYQIVFAYAYDSVMEVSPSGVMDITNAVL